jgi:hypothetical protein
VEPGIDESLLLRCKADPAFVATYLGVARPITRHIILGLVLLTLSGIGWLAMGYGFTPRLAAKIALVLAIWVLGRVIDNVIEPRFRASALEPGSVAFARTRDAYVAWEVVATGLFYLILILWMLR